MDVTAGNTTQRRERRKEGSEGAPTRGKEAEPYERAFFLRPSRCSLWPPSRPSAVDETPVVSPTGLNEYLDRGFLLQTADGIDNTRRASKKMKNALSALFGKAPTADRGRQDSPRDARHAADRARAAEDRTTPAARPASTGAWQGGVRIGVDYFPDAGDANTSKRCVVSCAAPPTPPSMLVEANHPRTVVEHLARVGPNRHLSQIADMEVRVDDFLVTHGIN